MNNTKLIIGLIVLVIIGGGIWVYNSKTRAIHDGYGRHDDGAKNPRKE